MKYFKNAEQYSKDSDPYIAFSRDENGNDWYEYQKLFLPEGSSDKVSFVEATGLVLAVEGDASKMFPSTGVSIIEVEVGNATREQGIIYKMDVKARKIIRDEKAHLVMDYSYAVRSAESRISELRQLMDEVDFGITEDTVPSYRELLGRWVLYRKRLNDFDVDSATTLPTAPSEK